jgi:hypothetical protein
LYRAAMLLFGAMLMLSGPSAHAWLLFDLLGLSPQARQAKADEACKGLIDWAGQQANFAPVAPVDRAPGQRRASSAEALGPTPELRLFADEFFKPVFGKAFDELAPSERLSIHQQMFQTCQRSPTYGAAVARISQRLGTPFADVGSAPVAYGRVGAQTLSAAVVIDAVRKMRSSGSAVRAQMEAVNALPDTGASWQQFLSQKAQIEAQVGYLPTDQQEAARQQLVASSRRLASAAVTEVLSQAPGENQGIESLSELRRSLDEVTAIQGQANIPEALAARNELMRRRDAIVNAQIAQDRQALQAIPSTPAGRAEFGAWYGTHQGRLRDAELRASPDLVRLMQEAGAKRQEQLAPMQAQWLQRVEAAPSDEALREIQREAFALPIDTQTPTGQALAQAVRARQESLYKAQVLGSQANEARAAPTTGPALPGPTTSLPDQRPAVNATTSGEPTSEEMYDTIQSKLNLAAAEVRNMQSSCKSGGAKSNPMDALACLMGTMASGSGGAQPMKISRFQKLSCAPASGQSGYVCDYVLGVSGGAMKNMGSYFGGLVSGNNVSTARFVRTGDGWTTVPMPQQR